MAEVQFKLTGWQAAVAVVVVIIVVAVRFATAFDDKKDNPKLMRQLEVEMMTILYPDQVDRMRAALQVSDPDKQSELIDSIVSTKLTIDSATVSSPLFVFKSPKDVIVKVTYTESDASGDKETNTAYYRFNHSSIGNTWQYKGKSSAAGYRLNFM